MSGRFTFFCFIFVWTNAVVGGWDQLMRNLQTNICRNTHNSPSSYTFIITLLNTGLPLHLRIVLSIGKHLILAIVMG